MHKRAVTCNLCGKGFFPASLKIHQPQCLKKQQMMQIPCSYCQQEVRRIEMESHLKGCRAAHRQRKKDAAINNGRNAHKSKKYIETKVDSNRNLNISQKNVHSNDRGTNNFSNIDSTFGRVQCRHCGRKFDAGRIGKHQSICANLKHGPAKAVRSHSSMRLGVAARENHSKAANKMSQERHNRKAKLSAHDKKRKMKGGRMMQQPRHLINQHTSNLSGATSSTPKKKTSWRDQRAQLRASIKAGRQMTRFEKGLTNIMPEIQPSAPDSSSIPCPHCGRRFSHSAAERHIPICKNLTSTRPKPVKVSQHRRGQNTASNFMGKTCLDNASKWGGSQTARAKNGGHGGIVKGNHTSSDNPLWGRQ